MSITPYLDGLEVDPETKRVLGAALEMTRLSLGLADDFAHGIIARRIIELAKAGERNPDLLCKGAIEKLRNSATIAGLVRKRLDYASRVSAAWISCSSHPFVLRATLLCARSTTLLSSHERM